MQRRENMQRIPIRDFFIGSQEPLTLIAGPCVMESADLCLLIAERLQQIVMGRPIQLLFKASYDKANRSSIHAFRGPGMEKGLRILERIQKEVGLPVLTDVHSPEEATIVGSVCEMIQIPAFLCRQTDILFAAARTPAAVSLKKGQFLAPWDMANVVEKLEKNGKNAILLVERGSSFGYNNLVVDFRSLPLMRNCGYPVCFDATHAVQLPGGRGTETGGNREFVPHLTRAAVAVGVEALYLEVHPNPAEGKSDAATMLALDDLPPLLDAVETIHTCAAQSSHVS